MLAAIGADVTLDGTLPQGAVVGPESLVVIAVPTYQNGRGPQRHVMGSTRSVADGALAVWVFPDQVAWALGLDLDMRATWGQQSEGQFARAIGRVASHEILHALGATGHTRGGLMAAAPRPQGPDLARHPARGSRHGGHGPAGLRSRRPQRFRSWTPSLLRSAPFAAAPALLAAPGSGR